MCCVCSQCVDQGSKPKGTPIPLTDCEVEAVDLPAAAAAAARAADPANAASIGAALFGIRLSAIVNEYTFGCATREEQAAWIARIRAHKQLAIKQQMGHAPISADEKFAAQSGQRLVSRKFERLNAEAASGGGHSSSSDGMARPFMPM